MKQKPNVMIQGTASSVGKSVVAAAFCRIFKEDGYCVMPFKSQNMSLNSFITEEGLEMGRAQVIQAEAGGVKPMAAMNPILLKPTGEKNAQVIVGGKVWKTMSAVEYQEAKPGLRKTVQMYYQQLEERADVLVLEGAGSPAEINLQENDLVNMGMAAMADAPVLLVGDIDRGGVFASLIGTMHLLPEEDKTRVKGFIINKFRGDVSILQPGLEQLEEMTGIPVLGVIPYGDFDIEEEDGTASRLEHKQHEEGVNIVVLRLPRISNFTDFHWLENISAVNLRYVSSVEDVGTPDLLVIPGTKNTLEDLAYIRDKKLDEAIHQLHQAGTMICGVCGGFQMLGSWLHDPEGVESHRGSMPGLNLLPVETTFNIEKTTTQVTGHVKGDFSIKGYEIHMGQTTLSGDIMPFATIQRYGEKELLLDGGVSPDGQVWGTYIHGIFDNKSFVEDLLMKLAKKRGISVSFDGNYDFATYKEMQYRKLADVVRQSVDLKRIYTLMGLQEQKP